MSCIGYITSRGIERTRDDGHDGSMSRFDDDTQVEVVAASHFAATISDRWNALHGPNGGYLLALCVRALRHELPLPDPLAVSAFFLRPAAPGAATIRTEVVRTGRRIATGEAHLVQGERELVRVVASFTDLARQTGRTIPLSEPPKLPPPDDAVDVLAGVSFPGLTILDRYDYRMAARPGWMQGRPSGDPSMSLWLRFKDGRAPDPLALVAFVDAAYPAVLDIGEAGSSTVELTVHVRARPAPGWLACRVSTRHVIGGYHEEDFEIWDADGKLVAQSRQLALLGGG
jgi:acyl-CoA thioesterase